MCQLPLRPGFHITSSRYSSRIIVDRTTLGQWEEVADSSEYWLATKPKSSQKLRTLVTSSNSTEVIIQSSNYVNFNNLCSEDKVGFQINFVQSTCYWILIGLKQNLKIFPSQNYSNSHANWLIDRSKQILRSKEIIEQNFYLICQSQKENFINQRRYSTHPVTSGLLTPTFRWMMTRPLMKKGIRVLKKFF